MGTGRSISSARSSTCLFPGRAGLRRSLVMSVSSEAIPKVARAGQDRGRDGEARREVDRPARLPIPIRGTQADQDLRPVPARTWGAGHGEGDVAEVVQAVLDRLVPRSKS